MSSATEVVPYLDDDGLLRVGDRWVVIPDAQVPVVRLVLANPMRVIRHDEITSCYRQAGGKDRPTAVSSMLTRLAQRMRSVGLDLISVRARGVMLDPSMVRRHEAPPEG